jgi:2-polyprenyl-6-methoxyphenol hydroxylase-like FAD-dependent oxidoreductase
MPKKYDAIVVGARCAGSPLAMLLARNGHRVLLVDRATFPSDTVSTHVIHPLGAAALARWGLLDRLVATGCPPIDVYSFDFGPFTLSGSPGTAASPVSYCARRTILDKLLVDAAAEAGVEVLEGFTVDEVLTEEGGVVGIRGHSADGAIREEYAHVTVGADGLRSSIARAVHPEEYHTKSPLLACYYTYWRDLPMNGRFETYVRPNRGFAAAPTHDGLTLIVVGWPIAELAANQKDLETHYLQAIALAPAFFERLKGARREGRFAGTPVPNLFRKPYGRGWALVGDAGYIKDPITAQGITDAFRDAERCALAIHEHLSGTRPFDAAMADYQHARDAHALPMYEFTCQLARLEPPPPEMQQLLRAIHGDREATDEFVRMNAGTIPPSAFFSSPHVARATSAA